MKRVAITGLGFITSIGNSQAQVLTSLRECRTGVEYFPELAANDSPVTLAGTIKQFQFPTPHFEDWSYPSEYRLTREQLRPMTPNSLYAWCAMQQAIADAKLQPEQISHDRTGLFGASAGSMWLAYDNLHKLNTQGVAKCPPMGIINGIPGSLHINLASLLKIKGATLGFVSACSSSTHALGAAFDLIRYGRQDTMFVVGAEDCNRTSLLPFASVRALSTRTDPATTPCAFDVKRDGFVGTGGATVLVLEEWESAHRRGATIYAEFLGWGQSSDGYNVLAPDPTGNGLHRAMLSAINDAAISPAAIDYINAHAPSTPAGDASEIAAIKSAFAGSKIPFVSSTKSLTGHGLSLAGAMETAFCCLALKEKFTPVSAHITELDPMCEGVPIVTQSISEFPKVVMKNSSGFGGTNVSLILRAAADEK